MIEMLWTFVAVKSLVIVDLPLLQLPKLFINQLKWLRNKNKRVNKGFSLKISIRASQGNNVVNIIILDHETLNCHLYLYIRTLRCKGLQGILFPYSYRCTTCYSCHFHLSAVFHNQEPRYIRIHQDRNKWFLNKTRQF